jgi:hypothetical protein
VDEDEFAASRRAHAKHPDGAFFGLRVGYRTSGTLGVSGVRIRRSGPSRVTLQEGRRRQAICGTRQR